MTRFTAIASDDSDDDGGVYSSHEPAKSLAFQRPTQVTLTRRQHRRDDSSSNDEDGDALSDSGMDEDNIKHGPARRRHRDKALVEGPDGAFYHPHELDSEESDSNSSEHSARASPSAQSRNPGVIPWAQQIGVDAQKLHVMQASLFRSPDTPQSKRAQASHQGGASGSIDKPIKIGGTAQRGQVDDDMLGIVPEENPLQQSAPLPYRPVANFPRVDAASSFVNGAEGTFIDGGLAFGRSFRVGWGPGGSLAYLGRICSPNGDCGMTANSSLVSKSNAPLMQSPLDAESLASKLLTLHLANSPILLDADGVPIASPSTKLCFASFASLFPSSDYSFEAQLFRLGQALFDDLDLRLSKTLDADIRSRIHAVRRKSEFSMWLTYAVAASVESEMQQNASASTASSIFSLLTGHNIDQACEVAMSSGETWLATLVAQAGGDHDFREDLRSQLKIWRDQRIDVHIDADIRRVYGLLAGLVDVLEGSDGSGIEQCEDVTIAQGLDWKRVFGLHYWYAQPLDAPIAQAFDNYEEHWRNVPERTAAPMPWYASAVPPVQSMWRPTPGTEPYDALYCLIRLYSDPSCPLSSIMDPRSFGESPVDYTLPWHLYILLSRCMRIRDFGDRDEPLGATDQENHGMESPGVEGHSPSADILASSYAQQLEQLGLIQEAVFVLLHLESSAGREKAVKDLLARSAPRLDDWMIRGLAGSLKIPLPWVNEAKAIYCVSSGSLYEAFELYLQAGLYNAAHELAVLELAPEAVLRDDLQLLSSLFERIADHAVDSWHTRGKVYLDYIAVVTGLPELRAHVDDTGSVPDAAQAAELDELTRSIPRLLAFLPDLLRDRKDPRHNAALSEMTSNLTRELDMSRPLLLPTRQLVSMPVDEATKLKHLQAMASARFLSHDGR